MQKPDSLSVLLALYCFIDASQVAADSSLQWQQYLFAYNQTDSGFQTVTEYHRVAITSHAGSDTNHITMIFNGYLEVMTKDEGLLITVTDRFDGFYQLDIAIPGTKEQEQRSAMLAGQAELVGVIEDEQLGTIYTFPKSTEIEDEIDPFLPDTQSKTIKAGHQINYLTPAIHRHPLYQDQLSWLQSPVTQELTVFMINPGTPSKKAKPTEPEDDEPEVESEELKARESLCTTPDSAALEVPALDQLPTHSHHSALQAASESDRLIASAHRAIEHAVHHGCIVTINSAQSVTHSDSVTYTGQHLTITDDLIDILRCEINFNQKGAFSGQGILISLGLQDSHLRKYRIKGKFPSRPAYSCAREYRRTSRHHPY